jgi:tRNA nucleotidyltransferase/poly(A) polymerase
LRWKIRHQSYLLSSISPSRLTEEIFKIIHSSFAGRIVEDLDSVGLYEFLQPQAVMLFKSKQGFRELYFKSFKIINQLDSPNRPGEAMAALVRDYLEETVDWTGTHTEYPATPQERYKDAFMAGRKFVMPMNPPRLELDHAVKLLFAEHGVTIKRSRFSDRRFVDRHLIDRHLSDRQSSEKQLSQGKQPKEMKQKVNKQKEVKQPIENPTAKSNEKPGGESSKTHTQSSQKRRRKKPAKANVELEVKIEK